jgi:hypothetical protein
MKKANPLFEQSKKLISLYLTKEDNISWPREIKIAKKLLEKYPIEFWQQYVPESKIYSLAAFLTPAAKREIEREHNLFLLTKENKPIILEDKPVVKIAYEEEKFKKPARSLIEFIDN